MATPFPFQSAAVLTSAQMNALTTLPVSTKTASYVLTVADLGTRVVMNSASATTITVNTSIFGASDKVEILNIGAGVCTITAGTCTVGTTGTLALVQNAGGTLTFISASASVFVASGVAAATSSIAIFNETQSAATDGGTSVTGPFIKRTLNTTVQNGITGCSIASSVITLPAGTYLVQAQSPFVASSSTKIKLRNTTDSTDAVIGESDYMAATNGGVTASLLGYFTIAGNKNFELQYRVSTALATFGLGVACNFGVSEIYSSITITKVA